jgi:uncharacterized protein (DUF608 family)
MPLGGIGTGQLAVAGDGSLRQWQIWNRINHLAYLPDSFFAIRATRIEPPLDVVRLLQSREVAQLAGDHTPLVNDDYIPPGQLQLLDRFTGVERTTFQGLYPFARVRYEDQQLGLDIELKAWSPWVPLDASASSFPAVIFQFQISNPGDQYVRGALGATLQNGVGWDGLTEIFGNRCSLFGGNVNRVRIGPSRVDVVMENPSLHDDDPGAGQMVLSSLSPRTAAYERWTDPAHFFQFMHGNLVGHQPHISTRDQVNKREHGNVPEIPQGVSPAGTTWNAGLVVPFVLEAGQSEELTFVIAWRFPNRYVNFDQYRFEHRDYGRNRFWLGNAYSERFPDAVAVVDELETRREDLLGLAERWESGLADSSLPGWLTEAMASQGSLIRSPTCFQTADGRFYGFEGSLGASTGMWNAIYGGSCPLNCTHVWGYEQALSRLFPSLERTVRETEFEHAQSPEGYIPHRTVLPLYLKQFWNDPIGGPDGPALDGMLSVVLRTYREARMDGDRAWLGRWWPNVRRLMEHIQQTWDANGDGVLEGEQPNTYDISFFGVNMFIGSLWLAALRAAEEMARLVGDDAYAKALRDRFEKGSHAYDEATFNGEYYDQRLSDHDAKLPYQYGKGCLSDQLLGQWWAHQLELGHLLPADHVRKALAAIVQHNSRNGAWDFNTGYRVFADQDDAGLVVCSWPRGERPVEPLRYADEVWTGIEYHVAAHCVMEGMADEGLRVAESLRHRYDGRRRNPYNEIECGDHYARAMAGWSLLEAVTGVRYDGFAQRVSVCPPVPLTGRFPFVAGSAWGTLELRAAELEIKLHFGHLPVRRIAAGAFVPRKASVDGKPLVASANEALDLDQTVDLQAGSTLLVSA